MSCFMQNHCHNNVALVPWQSKGSSGWQPSKGTRSLGYNTPEHTCRLGSHAPFQKTTLVLHRVAASSAADHLTCAAVQLSDAYKVVERSVMSYARSGHVIAP